MKRKLIRPCTVAPPVGAIAAPVAPACASVLTGSVGGADIDTSTARSTLSLFRHDPSSGGTRTLPGACGSGVVVPSLATDTKKQAAVGADKVGASFSRRLSARWQEMGTMRDAIATPVSICAGGAGKFPDQNVADEVQRSRAYRLIVVGEANRN